MSITIGKGITGQSGTLTIFGQSIPNYLSSVLSSIIGDAPWSISNPTSSFDLSNIGGLNDGNATAPAHYGIDNEVIVALYTGNIPEGSSVVARWYRSRDNRCVFTFNGGTAPSGGWGYFTAWIGWVSYATQISLGLSGQDEIVENGDYYVTFYINGSSVGTSHFTISGIPSSNIAFDSSTSNSISVHAWYGGSTPAHTCKIFCDSSNKQFNTQSYYGGSTNWTTSVATKTNLSPGTNHTFTAVFYDQAGYEITHTRMDTYSTQASPLRPSNFYWTTAELNAFNNHGSLTTLTYSRWNAFLDRITEFEVYKYGSAQTFFNKMTSSDKTLTAARFNQARFAIGSMYPTGITNKSSGDPVLGSYFITMANSLNSIT
jgi:hypothetical protein